MRLKDKLLVILLAILLLVVIPTQDLAIAWNGITQSSFIRGIYPYFEFYRFFLVALALFIVLGFLVIKKVIGSHRAFYAVFGAILILVSYFNSKPLDLMEAQLVSIFVIAGVEAAFIIAVKDNNARYRFMALIPPAVLFVFISSMFFVVFFGFALFLGAITLMGKTALISISDLNKKSTIVKASTAAKKGSSGSTTTPKAKPTNVTPSPTTQSSGSTRQQASSTPPPPKSAKEKKQQYIPPQRARPTVVSSQQAQPTPAPKRVVASAGSQQGSNGKNVAGTTGTDAERLGTLPTNVAWPAQSDYSRAMQNLSFSVSPKYDEIRAAKVSPNPYVKLSGNIVYSSGNYGTIFKLVNNGSTHALKCFTRSKPDLNRRYLGISKTLHSTKGDNLAFVDFQYLPDAVRTFKNPSIYFPALSMPWIEGENLNQYVTGHLNDKKALNRLADDFLYEMEKIRRSGISHGDISGDNIMVDRQGKLTLVDYDGMFVPAFQGMKAAEIGHDHFQHPARDSSMYSDRLDNFSILVTYLSLIAVAENPKLWDKYNGGDQDCLILRKKDFRDPRNSMAIDDLLRIRGRVRTLTNLLLEALSHGPLWPGTDPSRITKIKK